MIAVDAPGALFHGDLNKHSYRRACRSWINCAEVFTKCTPSRLSPFLRRERAKNLYKSGDALLSRPLRKHFWRRFVCAQVLVDMRAPRVRVQNDKAA
jgi:hypothetical protein